MAENQSNFHFLRYQKYYIDPIFKNLSSDAKVLYGILLDRKVHNQHIKDDDKKDQDVCS